MPELLDIIGQDSALEQLQRALAGERRPHAYIFAGAEGVGRRTTAVEFAKLLLCENPPARPNNGRFAAMDDEFLLRQACGQCDSCRTVSAGTNPDFTPVYKELARYHDEQQVRDRVMQNLSIDVVRQFLIDPAWRASVGGRGKVFVVRGAETMSIPAQNALLKTLEEPPKGVTIILICTSPAELLPTTRSRCQLVRFSPLPTDFVADALTADGVAPEEANFWAAMTGGSIGLASRRAGEKLYEFKKSLVGQLAGGDSPADLAEMLVKASEKLARKFRARDKDLAASLSNRQAGQVLLGLIAGVYHDALVSATGSSRPLVHADQTGAVERIAGRFEPTKLADILSQLARCEQLLWRNVNAKLLWDNVAVTCTSAAALEV
ncbi:MAG: DNA polymerase III subunit delta' C-terminal domain-containing protein [Planctomycetota bacterium]|nr:DNA polymerase III subunit delta' C-terminal domain-containing protein [Planctomycetota bacterium]